MGLAVLDGDGVDELVRIRTGLDTEWTAETGFETGLAIMGPGRDTKVIDDATLQLVPCCYRFKMTRFEEQKVYIYTFKSPYRLQPFQQKSLDGHSCCAASIREQLQWIFPYGQNGEEPKFHGLIFRSLLHKFNNWFVQRRSLRRRAFASGP